MTRVEAKKLRPGLYEIFWKSGGSSLAAVGRDRDGNAWFAPTNWVGGVPSTTWAKIEYAMVVECYTLAERIDNVMPYE